MMALKVQEILNLDVFCPLWATVLYKCNKLEISDIDLFILVQLQNKSLLRVLAMVRL